MKIELAPNQIGSKKPFIFTPSIRDDNKSLTREYPVRPDPNGSDFTQPDK